MRAIVLGIVGSHGKQFGAQCFAGLSMGTSVADPGYFAQASLTNIVLPLLL